MNYSTNYNLNKPERSEQFNIDHWNNNTDAIDTQMHINEVNIAQNATDIATLFTGLNTKNTSDTNSVFYKLMKLIYPVGSLYWSSKSTNPSTLFGGTWVQIKDRFVLACGDTYKTVGATGGASSVTLSVSNMPSHNHSFTPSGTVSSHYHSFLPKGTVGSSFSGTTHSFYSSRCDGSEQTGILAGQNVNKSWSSSNPKINEYAGRDVDPSISLKWTDSGTVSSNFVGTKADTGNATPTFTGTAGTTGSNGSNTAFSILPPYVVKYCWERTA